MSENRPFIITFIGDLNFLGALLSIMVFLFPSFFEEFGLYNIPVSNFSEYIMKILPAIILLISSYGYLKLKKWGYWLMVMYNMFFLILNIISIIQNKQLLASHNIITIFIQLIFILPTRKYFSKESSLM